MFDVPLLKTNGKYLGFMGSNMCTQVRRERISERLKVLQALIPNGDKVDMVTMLEKAITYVQCLELQIKVRYFSLELHFPNMHF